MTKHHDGGRNLCDRAYEMTAVRRMPHNMALNYFVNHYIIVTLKNSLVAWNFWYLNVMKWLKEQIYCLTLLIMNNRNELFIHLCVRSPIKFFSFFSFIYWPLRFIKLWLFRLPQTTNFMWNFDKYFMYKRPRNVIIAQCTLGSNSV